MYKIVVLHDYTYQILTSPLHYIRDYPSALHVFSSTEQYDEAKATAEAKKLVANLKKEKSKGSHAWRIARLVALATWAVTRRLPWPKIGLVIGLLCLLYVFTVGMMGVMRWNVDAGVCDTVRLPGLCPEEPIYIHIEKGTATEAGPGPEEPTPTIKDYEPQSGSPSTPKTNYFAGEPVPDSPVTIQYNAGAGHNCPVISEATMLAMEAKAPLLKAGYGYLRDAYQGLGADPDYAHMMSKVLLTMQVVESGMNPAAVSEKGAAGICQFMPKTAAWMGLKIDSPDERLDHHKCSTAMVKYFEEYAIKEYPYDLFMQVVSYNAGATGAMRFSANEQAACYAAKFNAWAPWVHKMLLTTGGYENAKWR